MTTFRVTSHRLKRSHLQVPPLENGDYVPLLQQEDGIIRSRVFPGLWLDVAAMLEGNMPQVLSVLQAWINSEQHLVFVQQLAGAHT